MKDRPLVSVYITNYNYARFIKQSIESVLNQSLQDFELLIIDDGSTDNSREIIEYYRDFDKIRIVYQHNKGLNVTNNIAMRSASGKYIVRLDADDYLEPTALESMSQKLEEDDQLGLVFPDYYYVNSDGVRIGEEKRHNFEKEVSLYDQPAHGACTMIRLSFLKELGGYNESFTCQDGYDLWLKFILHHKVVNVNKPLFSYRRHNSNLTSNEERILSTRKQIKEFFVDQHLEIPQTLAIIPARNTFIGDLNWPLYTVQGKSILQHKVETCVSAKRVSNVVITTSDDQILEHARQWVDQYKGVKLIKRPKEFARTNETLSRTVEHALNFTLEEGVDFGMIMSVSLEYPFALSDMMDEAVNTLALFKADSVLSVRPDNRMYYQHSGHTLTPILDQDKFTKLEREALYKGAGGVVVSTLKNFKETKQLYSGSVSHIVVDQKTSFGVFSEFDFELFKLLSAIHESALK